MSAVDDVDEQAGAPPPAGYTPPPGYGGPQAGLPNKTGKTALIVIASVSALLVIGTLAALAIFGVRRYTLHAKTSEGLSTTYAISSTIADCGEPLPPTSVAVPPTAPPGTTYMSSPRDWAQPAFSCGGGFTQSGPQYFSYQWIQDSSSSGRVVANADLNGDGVAELRVQATIRCSAGDCVATPPEEVPLLLVLPMR